MTETNSRVSTVVEYPNTKRIFLKASKIHDPVDRTSYLHDTCSQNKARLKRVDRLLQFVEEPEFDPLGAAMREVGHVRNLQSISNEDSTEDFFSELKRTRGADKQLCGCKIGPYSLKHVLGQGGMGTVYLAEKQDPLHRRVALKVPHKWLISEDLLTQFQTEILALERLDHPGIAKILDSQQTDSETPYLVMEIVDGVPITTACRARKLRLSERLSLFADTCRAVAYFHHQGVIHRDLKPGNILLTERNGTLFTKVIDFGIAVFGSRCSRTHESHDLSSEGILGTPPYLSPEQVCLSRQRIDIRSDIYSLGVVLYELVTDRKPFELDRSENLDFISLSAFIKRAKPIVPSEQLGMKTAVAAGLRAEIDRVVMKAISKCPEDRHQTVSEFVEDVHEIIAAC